MLGWKKHKMESRLLGEISITSDMQMPPQTAILLFAFLFHGDGLDPCLLYNVTNIFNIIIFNYIFNLII